MPTKPLCPPRVMRASPCSLSPQVPQGSVTPFAIANPEAAHVTLLLDHNLLNADRVYVHPLTNTASLGLSPVNLTKGLECVLISVTMENGFTAV